MGQACSVKMAGYWPHSFFYKFMDLDSVPVHKYAKKELGQFPAILTSHLVNNPYRVSMIVLIDILKDYSPKPTTLCIEHKS